MKLLVMKSILKKMNEWASISVNADALEKNACGGLFQESNLCVAKCFQVKRAEI